jgi:hypothetical protein
MKFKGGSMTTPQGIQFFAERQENDPVFKDVMGVRFGILNVPIETQVEVSRLPRTMDVLVTLNSIADIEVVGSETVFDYFCLYNQVEFKGQADPLTLDGYHLILGRRHLFLGEHHCSGKEMTTTIISSRQPRNVLYHCPDDVKWEQVGVGHYISTDLLPVHLFVCNELVIEPKNYPLLLFVASKRKFREFVERVVAEENTFYTYYAHAVDEVLTEEVLRMAGRKNRYEKNLERIFDKIDPERQRPRPTLEQWLWAISIEGIKEEQLKKLSPEERLQGLKPEQRVEGLTPEERLEGLTLEERLSGLEPELQEKILQVVNDSEDHD